jgi:hypothetical protein
VYRIRGAALGVIQQSQPISVAKRTLSPDEMSDKFA